MTARVLSAGVVLFAGMRNRWPAEPGLDAFTMRMQLSASSSKSAFFVVLKPENSRHLKIYAEERPTRQGWTGIHIRVNSVVSS